MVNLFYLLIWALPLENHWFWRFELVGSFTVLKLLGLICLLLVVAGISQTGFRYAVFRSAPTRWYLAYLAVQFSSYFVHGGDLPVEGAMYFNAISILALFVVTTTTTDSVYRLKRGLLVAIAGAAFASLYTIRGQQGAPAISGFRPSGIFDDANYYALVVGLWVPLAFLWSFGVRSKWERWFCRCSAAVMLLGTTFAASRGGFFGLGAALLFMIWHSRRRIRNLVVVLATVVPLLVFAPSSPLTRFLEPGYGDTRATDARLIAWKAGLRMVRAYPLTGVGLGNFRPLSARYEDSQEIVVSVAHNTYVETAAELGIPALVIHIGVLVSAFFSVNRVRKRCKRCNLKDFQHIAVGLQAGLLSYIISAVFVSSWWQKLPWLLVFFVICFEIVVNNSIRQRQCSEKAYRPDNNDLRFLLQDARSPGPTSRP